MAEVMTASIKEKLWHKMRGDLLDYMPGIAGNQLLMCCVCGRFLRQDQFSLEHIIPKQALKQDPALVRQNPKTPENVRAGNLLLCCEPLRVKGTMVYPNGCNSWKGRHYDTAIAELLSGRALKPGKSTQVHIIAALCLGYLAMVAEFGYRVALMPSGLMMREQFFNPLRFQRHLPVRSQMLLTGDLTEVPYDAPLWANPFSFSFGDGCCYFGSRNFSITLPTSQHPQQPIAKRLPFAPARLRMRPDFTTVFD